jgi:signal transduction histidine kinase
VAFVSVSHTASDLCVEVIDDGRAAAAAPSSASAPGHGIIGMRERVAAYDGEFAAGPRPAGGFRVVARFPLSGLGSVDRLRAAAGPPT